MGQFQGVPGPSQDAFDAQTQAIAKLPILKKISISGTTDANGDIGISGLSQATYPIAFLAGTNSSDVVTFFDGSQTAGYQKYAHFNSRKSVAVSGDVIYLEGTLIE